ncbi:MAG TPA: WecB/TagA/CpsF family glycosyltransferase [Candidatus Nanoarchaeia archaeon]|nr:WecB/TagA/CpsF family glycosyltransferase [Candidatus Nanoarchaeia archaeon]
MPVDIRDAKYSLFGVKVDALTIEQAIDEIIERAKDPNSPATYVVKPYVEFIERAATDSKTRDLLNGSSLCLADGIALNWAAYYLYGGERSFGRWLKSITEIVLRPDNMKHQLPDRILGTNLTWPLLQRTTAEGLKLFLIGTPASQTIKQTAEQLGSKIPGLRVAGYYTGSFPPGVETDLELILNQTRPDIILVGMGFPRQEQLMARLQEKLTHGVMIGEGGTFDYQQFGGKLPKAPGWVQKINLEWLWRLIRQPWRLKRQLAIPRFMWRVYQEGKRLD